MRKLIFASLVGFSLVSVSEYVYGMFNFFRGSQETSKSTDSRDMVTRAEISEKDRVEEGHKDDMRNQAEMFNNQIGDLTAQISRLTMFVQNLNDKVTTLTEQNESLKAENSALNQQITNFKDSTAQKQLEETQKANQLKQQELAQAKKLEADRLARNKKLADQIATLERRRDDWAGYLDGRKQPHRGPFGRYDERDLNMYHDKKKNAPGEIAAIDQRIATLRSQFEK